MRGMSPIGIGDIEVNKVTLIEKLRENRNKHSLEYQEAMVNFKQRVRDRLAQLHHAVASDNVPDREPSHWVRDLPRPEQYLGDYDRAIAMLLLDVGSTITLSEQAYAQFVDDEWEWKHSFAANATFYNGAAR
jgi:HPt (histidine-containing phosphotransfer) domain-containing protein